MSAANPTFATVEDARTWFVRTWSGLNGAPPTDAEVETWITRYVTIREREGKPLAETPVAEAPPAVAPNAEPLDVDAIVVRAAGVARHHAEALDVGRRWGITLDAGDVNVVAHRLAAVDVPALVARLRALQGGVRALAEMLGITDPDATVGDVAAGIERARLAKRRDEHTITGLLTAVDKAAGEATLARHQRDHLRRELDTVNLAAEEGVLSTHAHGARGCGGGGDE